jgi:hypothetical protein
MAVGKWKTYDGFAEYLGDGTHDLDDAAGHPLKIILLGSGSNANTLTHEKYGDLTGELATALGYTQGGTALAAVTWTRSAGFTTLDADDVTVATATGGDLTARYAAIYVDATVNGIVKPLVGVCLLNTTPADETASDGNPFIIRFNASGILRVVNATADA